MGIPSGTHDPRNFEHFAKVNDAGEVVAVIALADGTIWHDDEGAVSWTDGEGYRYVYVTDLLPLDIHGLTLLPPKAKTHGLMRLEPDFKSAGWS